MKSIRKHIVLLLFTLCIIGFGSVAHAEPHFINSTNCVTQGMTRILVLHDATDGTIKWKSSNKKIATVNSRGVVSGKRLGKCTVSAKYKGKTYKCKVKVCNARQKINWMPNYYEEILPANNNKDCILIAGSSYIERWKANSVFLPYKAVEIGIGYSKIKDWIKLKERMLVSYNPKALVLYIGGNDIADGMSGDRAAELYQQLLKELLEELPNTPIYVLEVAPAPARSKKYAQVKRLNNLMCNYCSQKHNLTYIGYSSYLMNNGKVSKKYFDRYGFHFSSKGYDIWNKVVAGIVKTDLSIHE